MKRPYFLLLIFILSCSGAFAQSDVTAIETGNTMRKYPVSDIAQLTFIGTVTMTGDKVIKANALLKSFALQQNYPNTFTEIIKVRHMVNITIISGCD